jgi:hypothetical protein
MLGGTLVTTAWRVLRLRLEVWRVAANILNKQSRTAEKGWPSILGVGRGILEVCIGEVLSGKWQKKSQNIS